HVDAWLEREWKQERTPETIYRGKQILLPSTPSNPIQRLIIKADLQLRTSLLIRSAGEIPEAPDLVHLSDGGQPVISGTALAGALRHRCERVANTLGFPDTDQIITSMFGPHADDMTVPRFASRVRVEECKLAAGELHVQNRVSIDRFTGGALETRLF